MSGDMDATVLERLRKLGGGDARTGFGWLCTAAGICSLCCQERGTDGRCGCTP